MSQTEEPLLTAVSANASSHSEEPLSPKLSAIYAQRLYGRVVYTLAPAAVASVITWQRTGRPGTAALVFVAMLVTSSLVGPHRYPLGLVPVARYLLGAITPAAGIAMAVLAAELGDSPIPTNTALNALGGAWLITALAMGLADRFASDRPIRLALIGPAALTERLTNELAENDIEGYQVVGYIDDSAEPHSDADWLGALPAIRAIVQRHGVDLLVVAPQSPRLRVFEETAKACLDLPVRMIEATALYEDVLGHVPLGAINSAWFQFIMHPRYSPSSPLSKRVLDLVVSGGLVIISAPVLVLCALAVKLADGGPVFYYQRRVGEEGREFDMIKFRTLRPDADEMFAAGHEEEELITPVGRVLRRGHLNELPQLVQVLKGDMSLVGPRPEPPALVRSLRGLVPHYERRALVKPGLTGWAQVRCGYAGSHFGTAWKTCHDLYYIKHRSARFDLIILLQTFHALVEREDVAQLPAQEFILGERAEQVAS